MKHRELKQRSLHAVPTLQEYGIVQDETGKKPDEEIIRKKTPPETMPTRKTHLLPTIGIIVILFAVLMYVTQNHRSKPGVGSSTSESSGQSGGSGFETDTAEDENEVEKADADSGTDITGLAESGKLHMATNIGFPPYEWEDESGGYLGIDIEVAGAIAEKLHLTLVVDDMPWEEVTESVRNRESDIAMAAIHPTEERKEILDFTEPYTALNTVILVRAEMAGIQDLDGMQVGCVEDSIQMYECQELLGAEMLALYVDASNLLESLIMGTIDCVAVEGDLADLAIAENAQLAILEGSENWFEERSYAIGISKDHPELCAAVNDALAELKESGTVQEILYKYLGIDSQ